MKARVKDTGEIVDVKYEYVDNAWRVKDGEYRGYRYHERELDFFDDTKIDWEQRRYEIAKDMLAAFFSNPSSKEINIDFPDIPAGWAVEFADALITELEK